MAAQKPTTDHHQIRAWAHQHDAVPCEVLPHIIDGEPAVLRFMLQKQVSDHADIRMISWEEFFLKFDALGLTFVYEEGRSERNEILQIEERSPYKAKAYGVDKLSN